MSVTTVDGGDTPIDVVEHLVDRWRQMSARDKLERVAELNRACEVLSEAGVRVRHPGADEDEVRRRVRALRLGREAMVAVYGWDPDVEGW